MKDMNVSTETMTAKEIKSKLGVYFSIPRLYIIRGKNRHSYDQNNFLDLLHKENKIDFIFDFLNKKHKNKSLNIFENLKLEYGGFESGTSKTIKGVKIIFENQIQLIISKVIRQCIQEEEKYKQKNNILSLLFKFTRKNKQEKIDFIIKNKDIYKDKIEEFVNFNIIPIEQDETKLFKVPSFLKEKIINDYNIYNIIDDEIKTIKDSFIFQAELDHETNSISLVISTACENRPLIFDSRKNKFVFKDENIFGTKDDAINELTKRNIKK